MKFELEDYNRGITDEALLSDLCKCAVAIGRDTITIAEYAEVGKVHSSTFQRRFGSSVKALQLAGLKANRRIGIGEDELFGNIEQLWISLGRQPRYTEVKAPISQFSAGIYENRFGSWRKALAAFIEWVNSEEVDRTPHVELQDVNADQASVGRAAIKRRTNREISDRQRFRILVRDGFRCMTCGASPLVKPGVELQVDHITPWSKGGETVIENLQSKCKQCNLGKGNAFHV